MLGQTEMNIKSIVEPYENRIKELEELIRKKDFEIAVLKQKIFNINGNKSQNINNEQDRINVNQNKITNNSIIQVNQKNLMNLIFDYRGMWIPMTIDGNTSIGIAIILFLQGINRDDLIMQIINNENSMSFIYNMTKYSIKDIRSIGAVFVHNSKIAVIQHGDMIGG